MEGIRERRTVETLRPHKISPEAMTRGQSADTSLYFCFVVFLYLKLYKHTKKHVALYNEGTLLN